MIAVEATRANGIGAGDVARVAGLGLVTFGGCLCWWR
jgi:hypothetical protein